MFSRVLFVLVVLLRVLVVLCGCVVVLDVFFLGGLCLLLFCLV